MAVGAGEVLDEAIQVEHYPGGDLPRADPPPGVPWHRHSGLRDGSRPPAVVRHEDRDFPGAGGAPRGNRARHHRAVQGVRPRRAGGGGGLLHVFVPHTTAGVAVIELGAGSDAGLLAALSAWEPVVTKLHVYYCFELYHELDDLTVAFWLISPQSRELNCKGPPFKRRAHLAMIV